MQYCKKKNLRTCVLALNYNLNACNDCQIWWTAPIGNDLINSSSGNVRRMTFYARSHKKLRLPKSSLLLLWKKPLNFFLMRHLIDKPNWIIDSKGQIQMLWVGWGAFCVNMNAFYVEKLLDYTFSVEENLTLFLFINVLGSLSLNSLAESLMQIMKLLWKLVTTYLSLENTCYVNRFQHLDWKELLKQILNWLTIKITSITEV